METPTNKYTAVLLEQVHSSIHEIFNYNLTTRQLQILLNKQPTAIINDLVTTNGSEKSIKNLTDSICMKITGGIKFPLPDNEEAHKKRFYLKLNMKKDKYFKPIVRIKV